LRVKRASKLVPFKVYITGRIKAAKPNRLPVVSFCWRSRQWVIRIANAFFGLRCARSLPRSRLSALKRLSANRPRSTGTFLDEANEPLSVFVMTLGYSRFTYVEFVTDERFKTLRACHEHAFAAIAGVQCEMLYGMHTVVVERNAHGQGKHRFHFGLWGVSKHFGFVPRLCAPYCAQTKGKVERFIGYLRRSFYVPLARWLAGSGLVLDAATANAEVWRWLHAVANDREHGTIGQRPIDLLEQEKPGLLPLSVRQTVQTPASKSLAKTVWAMEMLQCRRPVTRVYWRRKCVRP